VCFWERAIPLVIDFDYTMSQTGAGCRYNVSPQMVLQGQPVTFTDIYGGQINRNPDHVIQFEAGDKDPDGISTNGGDAHLLEMTGKGIEVTIENYCYRVITMALKLICASLKDPQKITAAMSGQAITFLEQESLDLLEELRTHFGKAFLKFLKLIAVAGAKSGHEIVEGLTAQEIDETTLKWPPLTGIGADEIQQMAQGLVQLVTAPPAPGAAGPGAGGEGAAPQSAGEPILDVQQARDFVESKLPLPRRSANRSYEPKSKAPKNPDQIQDGMRPPEATGTAGPALLADAMPSPDELSTSLGIEGT
jgi:hypothetical protein